jgi:hypothetical protein
MRKEINVNKEIMNEKRESNAKRKELEAKGKTKGKANFEGVNFWTAYPRASVIGPQLCMCMTLGR